MLYKPSWNSLKTHATPKWFQDAKFGIYTHWGIYSVPACGPNGSWYPYNMYREGTPQYEHHVKTYGHPSKFGYKDFIPMFKAEKFDADEWAELFKKAGAQFAGPVGEHHDGFSMWDSEVNEWDVAKMGPKRDVVGELERAIRKQDMRFMVALHHAAEDIRFTVKDDALYAICLGWPRDEITIKSMAEKLYHSEIRSIKMLGVDEVLPWKMTKEGLKIKTPTTRKLCDHAYVFKIERKHPF